MNRWLGGGGSLSPLYTVVSIVLVCLLLAGSIYGIWWTFSNTIEEREEVQPVKYEQTGVFDYDVWVDRGSLYGLPKVGLETDVVYYRNIVSSIDVVFGYAFFAAEELNEVVMTVEIYALLEDPERWQKEVVLVPKTTRRGPFTLNFPLDLYTMDALSNAIEDDIDLETAINDLTIVASVHVEARTASDVITDDFTQSTTLRFDTKKIEWEPGLTQSKTGSFGGQSYEHRGYFDYTIYLKDNDLYTTSTLKPQDVSDAGSPMALPSGQVYFMNTVDYVDGRFSYNFDCSDPLNNVAVNAKVTALLEHPNYWSQAFDLAYRTTGSSDFSIIFPIDVHRYLAMTDTIRQELGLGSATYNLTITADVRLEAVTDNGDISEDFSHSLKGKLSATTLTFEGSLEKTKSGEIRHVVDTATIFTSSPWPARAGALVGFIVAVAIGFYVLMRFRSDSAYTVMSAGEQAARLKKKRKDVIVDVEDLPEAVASEMVVSLNSLEELVKAADALLKPVLHKADLEKHTYRVIDGITTYEYVSAESALPDESEPGDMGEMSI